MYTVLRITSGEKQCDYMTSKKQRQTMPRTKDVRYCILCSSPFHRHNGNTGAKYCSRQCACRDRNTTLHQSKAGKFGALHNIQKRGKNTKGYVKFYGRHLHRVMVEICLGIKLSPSDIVHHKDGNKTNNTAENLQVLTRAEHARLHFHGRI